MSRTMIYEIITGSWHVGATLLFALVALRALCVIYAGAFLQGLFAWHDRVTGARPAKAEADFRRQHPPQEGGALEKWNDNPSRPKFTDSDGTPAGTLLKQLPLAFNARSLGEHADAGSYMAGDIVTDIFGIRCFSAAMLLGAAYIAKMFVVCRLLTIGALMCQPDDEHPERVLLQADAILVIQPTWLGWLTAFVWRLPTTPIKVYLEVGYCEVEGPVIGTPSFQMQVLRCHLRDEPDRHGPSWLRSVWYVWMAMAAVVCWTFNATVGWWLVTGPDVASRQARQQAAVQSFPAARTAFQDISQGLHDISVKVSAANVPLGVATEHLPTALVAAQQARAAVGTAQLGVMVTRFGVTGSDAELIMEKAQDAASTASRCKETARAALEQLDAAITGWQEGQSHPAATTTAATTHSG